MQRKSGFLSVFLIPFLIALPICAEVTAPASVLQVHLLDADTANSYTNTINNGYTIQVTDAAGVPIAEAAVSLRLPEDGASGSFADGSHSAVAYTDASGHATFAQIHWGGTAGTAVVRLTVVKGSLHAGALLEQTIYAATKPPAGSPAAATAVAATTPSAAPATPASPNAAATAQAATASATPPVPGTPATVVPSTVHSGALSAANAQNSPENKPVTNAGVTVTNTSASSGNGPVHSGAGNTKKWILIAAVIAAAGVGTALALGGHGSSTTQTAAVSIGTPIISVGH